MPDITQTDNMKPTKYYKDIINAISKKSIDPVYFFWGDEDFLKDDAISKISQILLDKTSCQLNYIEQYASDCDIKSLIENAQTFSFMVSRKIIVLRDTHFLNKKTFEKERELVLTYIKNPVKTTCFILVLPKFDEKGNIIKINFEKSEFYKLILENTASIKFNGLNEAELNNWIVLNLKQQGKAITKEAIKLLLDKVGNDLTSIINELSKLSLYVGDKRLIERSDILVLVNEINEDTVFKLADAIGYKKNDDALKILQNLLDSNAEILHILVMIARHFRLIWKAKSLIKTGKNANEACNTLRINKYFQENFIKQLSLFPETRLLQGFKSLLTVDSNIKTGKSSPKLLLELLIYRDRKSVV